LSDEDFGALVAVFDDITKVRALLLSAAMDPGRLPMPAGPLSPESYWRLVIKELNDGRFVEGVAKLMMAAADQYPGNPVFARWGALPSTLDPLMHDPSEPPDRPFLNYDAEQHELRRWLLDSTSKIVLVHGPTGAGKSALVDKVLAGLRSEQSLHIHRHEAVPGTPLDIRTLTDYIASGVGNSFSRARVDATGS